MPRSPSTERWASKGGTPGTEAVVVRAMKSNTSCEVCLKARFMGKVGKGANLGSSS